MKKVYTNQIFPLAGHVHAVLIEHNINCVIRNEFLSGAAGEIPPNECWPQVWIIDDWQFDRAMELVDSITVDQPVAGEEAWTCPQCNEALEPQFSTCWKCGQHRDQ